MTDRTLLITGWINFAILTGVLTLFLRPLFHHFFFKRRNRIKESISRSVDALELARERRRLARERGEVLDEDIAERGLAIKATCEKECSSIIDEARSKQRHILDNAARGSDALRYKTVEMVRVHMLENAFIEAKEIFQRKMSEGKSKILTERALDEFFRNRVR